MGGNRMGRHLENLASLLAQMALLALNDSCKSKVQYSEREESKTQRKERELDATIFFAPELTIRRGRYLLQCIFGGGGIHGAAYVIPPAEILAWRNRQSGPRQAEKVSA